MQTAVSLASSGLGVAIVPASVAHLARQGVTYRQIADPDPRLDPWLALRRGLLGGAGSTAGRDFLIHGRGVARSYASIAARASVSAWAEPGLMRSPTKPAGKPCSIFRFRINVDGTIGGFAADNFAQRVSQKGRDMPAAFQGSSPKSSP
jgi:hypothetical protein